MKFDEIKKGMHVYDRWWPVERYGQVCKVLKTCIYVSIPEGDVKYDKTHCQFLEKSDPPATKKRKITSRRKRMSKTKAIVVSAEELLRRVNLALDKAVELKEFDGAHHKDYAIDQIVRALTGCPIEMVRNSKGVEYEKQGESDEYKQLVAHARQGSEGSETYDWDIGVPP